jgi:hypothetical protein
MFGILRNAARVDVNPMDAPGKHRRKGFIDF